MIGGVDVVIPTNGPEAALDFAVRAIRTRWPAAVFEYADSDHSAELHESFSFEGVRELFVYQDQQTARLWTKLGADETLRNTMIHLIAMDDGLTIVVDDPEDGTARFVIESVRSATHSGRLQPGIKS